ncbi:hypothetical protein AB0E11_27610 [Streptomyces fradiae]|uniref:hypothetical protein n=1 Tax=Streptomyces fradiae TaxID=1906 RepID=UPI0033CD4B43
MTTTCIRCGRVGTRRFTPGPAPVCQARTACDNRLRQQHTEPRGRVIPLIDHGRSPARRTTPIGWPVHDVLKTL